MSCDRVEKSGRKVTTTSYQKLLDLETSALKEELSLLAESTKQLAPKISAAGFFTLNQALLVSMFSSATTYVIIIIQFNLSSDTK